MHGEGRRTVVGGLVAVAVAAGGVTSYVLSDRHSRHDPQHSLQQLDLLYLDEPAPGRTELGVSLGRSALVVFCPDRCPLPDLRGAQVVRSTDLELAREYALGAGGRTGLALIDADGDVRYRSYDPAPHEHEAELQTLVDAL